MQTSKSKITGRFLIMTVFLIIIIIFCISGTVKARGTDIDKDKQQYIHELEREYLMQLKDILIEEGYTNSGITLTKVEEYQESQDLTQVIHKYTVRIHHKRIRTLSGTEQEQLRKQIAQIKFAEQNSIFQVQL